MEAKRDGAGTGEGADVAVYEDEGRRRAVWSGESGLSADPSASDGALDASIEVVDGVSGQSVTCLLVNREGVPLGPVLSRPIRVEPWFRGWIVAEGYVTAELVGIAPTMRVSLVRAGNVCGRLGGNFEAGEEVSCTAGEAREAVAVDAEGHFELVALPAGEASLGFVGRHGHVRPFRFLVREGWQDLGTIPVAPLLELVLRLDGLPDANATAHVALFDAAHRDRATATGVGVKVTAVEVVDGIATMRHVRDVTMSGAVWTESGERGEVPICLPGSTLARSPLVVRMEPPGRLCIHTGVGAAVPGATVVAVDPWHGIRPESIARVEVRNPQVRARCALVGAAGTAEIDRLWPGRYEVALVGPLGDILARAEATIAPAGTTTLALIPPPMARVRVVNVGDRPTRFAMLGDDGGVAARATVEARGEVTVEFLPERDWRILDWPAGSQESRVRDLAVGHSGTQVEIGGR